MGVKNLTKLLKNIAGIEGKNVKITEFSGKKFAIDTSIFLYKFNYLNTNYVISFLKMIENFLKNNIVPVFCFDEEPHELKDRVLKERKEHHEKAQEKYEKEEDKKKAFELKKQFIEVEFSYAENLKKIFNIIGIPYVSVKKCEAEMLCGILNKNGMVAAVISEDSDLLAHGTKKWIKNYSNSKKNFDLYELDEILENLGFTEEQFIDMCILLGNDYNERIYGEKTSYNLIDEYGSIENIIKEKGLRLDFDYKEVRKLFNGMECFEKIDKNLIKRLKKTNKELIEEIKKNCIKKEVENIIENVLRERHCEKNGDEIDKGVIELEIKNEKERAMNVIKSIM